MELTNPCSGIDIEIGGIDGIQLEVKTLLYEYEFRNLLLYFLTLSEMTRI